LLTFIFHKHAFVKLLRPDLSARRVDGWIANYCNGNTSMTSWN